MFVRIIVPGGKSTFSTHFDNEDRKLQTPRTVSRRSIRKKESSTAKAIKRFKISARNNWGVVPERGVGDLGPILQDWQGKINTFSHRLKKGTRHRHSQKGGSDC